MADKVEPFWKKRISTKQIPKDETKFDIIIVGGGPAGWDQVCHTFSTNHDEWQSGEALVIQARLYSGSSDPTVYFICSPCSISKKFYRIKYIDKN